MKSNGTEQRIHISKQAYDEIRQTDDFQTEYRGKVNLKGRGDMDCYWLIGVKKKPPRNTFGAKVGSKLKQIARIVNIRFIINDFDGFK